MAKKLTQQTLEKMVLQTMNESKEVNEIFGAIKNWASGISQPASTLFGRKPTLPKARTMSARSAMTDIADFLEMLAYERDDLPKDVREYAGELADRAQAQSKAEAERVKTAASLPTVELPDTSPTSQSATGTEWDLEEIPDENVTLPNDLPSRMPTTKGVGAPNMNRRPTSVYSSPQAMAGATKQFRGKGSIPHLPRPEDDEEDTSSTAKEPANKVAESKRIEAMVMEAMEEVFNMTGKDMFGKKTSKSEVPTVKDTSLPSPQAVAGPTKHLRGKAAVPSLSFDDEGPTTKMAGGVPTTKMNSPLRKKVAENKLEALVAEVLKEMSKKQPVKEPKKPVKK